MQIYKDVYNMQIMKATTTKQQMDKKVNKRRQANTCCDGDGADWASEKTVCGDCALPSSLRLVVWANGVWEEFGCEAFCPSREIYKKIRGPQISRGCRKSQRAGNKN